MSIWGGGSQALVKVYGEELGLAKCKYEKDREQDELATGGCYCTRECNGRQAEIEVHSLRYKKLKRTGQM